MNNFYTYLIGWSKLDKWYYGARYSSKAKITDLWESYFTSSSYVRKFREENGEPDVIQVRKTFNTKKKVLEWESKVLRRMNVVSSDRFLNKWDNNMVPINMEPPFPFEFADIQNKVDISIRSKYGNRGSGSPIIRQKVEDTNLRKYGKTYTTQLPQVAKRRKESIEKIYDTDNPFKNNAKLQEVMKKRHGVTNAMHKKEVKEKHKNTMSNKDWTERDNKTKEVMKEKYGVTCSMNMEKHKRFCPYGCSDKKYNAGGFSIHMKSKHNWSTEEIKEFKMQKTKKIQMKDVEAGMKIKTLDPDTKCNVFKKITDVWDTTVTIEDQVQLEFENGSIINCSINHPIMIIRGDKIVEVNPLRLTTHDIVITENGKTRLVKTLSDQNNNENYIDITVEDTHTFYTSHDPSLEMVLTHNSQGGIRGGAATVYALLWHPEIENILVLKNNKGTQDNRVRQLDYGIIINNYLYQRLIDNGKISLFSPHEVRDLYDAYFEDPEKFGELYEKYEKDKSLVKGEISARELFTNLMTERKDTGRIYVFNTDNVQNHSNFLDSVKMSNLCVAGNTKVNVMFDGMYSTVDISQIGALLKKHGDVFVKSYNHDTSEIAYEKITNFALMDNEADVIKVEDTETGASIVCTPDHEIYTKNRGYIRAMHLNENDVFVISSNSEDVGNVEHSIKITNLKTPQPVYDISVENTENFYANDMLVHNCAEITLITTPMATVEEYEIYCEKDKLMETLNQLGQSDLVKNFEIKGAENVNV